MWTSRTDFTNLPVGVVTGQVVVGPTEQYRRTPVFRYTWCPKHRSVEGPVAGFGTTGPRRLRELDRRIPYQSVVPLVDRTKGSCTLKVTILTLSWVVHPYQPGDGPLPDPENEGLLRTPNFLELTNQESIDGGWKRSRHLVRLSHGVWGGLDVETNVEVSVDSGVSNSVSVRQV